ncbi:MAG: M18 family aminopeptidase [Muribaculaceae bacterium]|nr:M18 family aminopeptidase [Muribaculaceae bacterium]
METNPLTRSLLSFLDASVCNFLASDTVARFIRPFGFTELDPADEWHLERGGNYFVRANNSSIFAFSVGTGTAADGYRIIAAHSDSPGFRIKPAPVMVSEGGLLKLNVEVYGGPILYTWFDRPLSISGRVIVKSTNPLRPATRLVKIDRPLMTIPHLAIHFNRQVNDGNKLSRQKDMLPVVGIIKDEAERNNLLLNLVAESAGVSPADILDFDLTLYDVTPASLFGPSNEFISSGRIDDLMMVHAATTALTQTVNKPCKQTRIAAIFDNEETGSGTKQGAASPVLQGIIKRINAALGGDVSSYERSLYNSFMISADNAHATHPNYVDKMDPTNHPVLGGGPVIKINADCKYMTDAESAAIYSNICELAGVKYQYFVNHSDSAGGSTLGNKSAAQLPLRGVDMGAPQLAMHSCREMAAVSDHIDTIASFATFFSL